MKNIVLFKEATAALSEGSPETALTLLERMGELTPGETRAILFHLILGNFNDDDNLAFIGNAAVVGVIQALALSLADKEDVATVAKWLDDEKQNGFTGFSRN